jgi:radical SAM enzyme (TIGR01210 family)
VWHSGETKKATAVIFLPFTEDRRIRSLRAPQPSVDPWVAHGSTIDHERRPRGTVERALTVFLAGAECPFTCSFCDLWRWTLEGPTPPGALPAQLARVLGALEVDRPLPDRLKLYNASNFFDHRAVPPEDIPALADLARPFTAVTVESHATMIGPAVLEFARLIPGRLEVAIGLETIHPAAARHLNKRMDLSRFDRAAEFLAEHDIDLRVFVLLGAPYVAPAESVEWAVRTAEYAARRGAAAIALIPVRGGNGELERLAALGHFAAPSLPQLEAALDRCLGFAPAAVAADLWDVDRLDACAECRPRRVERLRRLNLTGRGEPPVTCSDCD